MDGYELARRLRQRPRARRLGLIAVTGYGLDGDQRRSTDAGFDAHLVKPVDVERLEQLLRALTGVPAA
jgi:CheY-like chemotaxis protein